MEPEGLGQGTSYGDGGEAGDHLLGTYNVLSPVPRCTHSTMSLILQEGKLRLGVGTWGAQGQ